MGRVIWQVEAHFSCDSNNIINFAISFPSFGFKCFDFKHNSERVKRSSNIFYMKNYFNLDF